MPFVSAGVYSVEQDLSTFASTVVQTIYGMPGCFNKGPIGEEVEVSSQDDLVSQFGKPISPGTGMVNYLLPQGWYSAREFLRRGNRCKVVRAESTANPALYAAASLPAGSDDTLATADDGATSIPATRTLTSAGAGFAAAGVLIGDVVEVCDVGTPADNGFYVITLVAPTVLTVDRDWPTGSLTNLTYKVWSGKRESGADGVTSAAATRQLTSAGSTFLTNGVTAGMILKINSSGQDDGVYVITNVAATVLTVNRDWPKGGLNTQSFTVYGYSSKGSDGSTAVAGTFSSAGSHFALHGVKAGDILRIKDAVDSGCNGFYVITAAGDTTLTVAYNRTWPASLTNLDFEVWPAAVLLTPKSKGTWITGYQVKTSRNSGNTGNFDLSIYDPTGVYFQERIYDCNLANIITNDDVSQFFTASVITNRTEPACGNWVMSSLTPARPENYFSGGDDGTTGIVDADYLTALNVLKNPEKTQLSMAAVPGQTSQAVTDGLVTFCETRADCIALVDPPDWSAVDSVQDILNWHNGVGGLGRTSAFNTSYGCLQWTWQEVFDEYNNVSVWTAPSGHIAADFAYTDLKAYPWYAPAGFRRGKLLGSQDTRYSPDQGDRDAMQNGTQCVNPIVNFVGQGITLFGQKTLLRSNSALNRINVRRMLLQVETVVAGACRYLTFEPDDDTQFREFRGIVDPVLDNVLSKRGIREYSIVDKTTDADRDNNTLRPRMYIKPTKANEIIILEFALVAQGANITELVQAAA